MADPVHSTSKRGGDRNSAQAKAERAAKWPASLVSEIAERRQQLDQNFYDHLRELRRRHGDRAVDQALGLWQEQRDAVAIAPKKERRGPNHFYRERA
jgi:hypothetical protein